MARRSEVVNNIEKHQNSVPKVRKMVPRRGWTSLLGLLGSHMAPQWPQGRFFEVFRFLLGGHFGGEIDEKWGGVSMCFRDSFWMGFGVISGLFWETFKCQNDAQKEKG